MIFNSDRHEYSDNGIIIQSVTQLLKAAGIIDDRFFSAEARDRGSAVHELCERYANGERYDNIGRELASLEYVNAFASWQHDSKAYALRTESIIHGEHNGKRYAGRCDGLFEIRGQRVLVDFKTGAPVEWHSYQLAAYALASFEDGTKVNPNYVSALYFHADGTYHDDRLSGARLLNGIAKFKECL